jgi:hypothetical protein
MEEYRQKIDTVQTETTASSSQTDPQTTRPRAGQNPAAKVSKLRSKYGLEKGPDIAQPRTRSTVNQEFQSYANAAVSSKDTDIVNFWAVSGER